MRLIINIPYGLKDVYEHGNVTALDVEEMKRALQNATPIPDNATVCDIDAIKAEIDKQAWAIAISDTDRANGMWDAYRIIDKYREEQTDAT